MLEWSFQIQGRVVPWQRARSHGARRYVAPEVRGYKTALAAAALAARPMGWGIDEPVELEITVVLERPARLRRKSDPQGHLPAPVRPDIDNCAKVVMDSLNGVAYRDDGQVVSLQVLKWYAPIGDGPGLVVTVRAA